MVGKPDRQSDDEATNLLGSASDDEILDYIASMSASLEALCLRRDLTVLAGLFSAARQIASGADR